MVTREALPVGMEVHGYTQVELKRLRDTLPGFELRGRVPIQWSDATGEALLTRWRSADGSMDQILACRRVHGRRLLVFTATHPTPFPTPAYEALLRAIAGFVPHLRPTPTPLAEPR